jgi:hypothetical protein
MQRWLSQEVSRSLKRNEILRITRVEAAKRLVSRWNPFPFDPKVQFLWKILPREEREDLRERLSDWIMEACEELAATRPRSWRFDRQWLKDATGRVVECKLQELPLPKPVKALRNSVRKKFEAAILQVASTRSLKDSDGVTLSRESQLSGIVSRNRRGVFVQNEAASVLDDHKSLDDSADVTPDDSVEFVDALHKARADLELLEQCPIYTRREHELISHLRRQFDQGRVRLNLSAAAQEMRIKASTAWVHHHNIIKKLPRAQAWIRMQRV